MTIIVSELGGLARSYRTNLSSVYNNLFIHKFDLTYELDYFPFKSVTIEIRIAKDEFTELNIKFDSENETDYPVDRDSSWYDVSP